MCDTDKIILYATKLYVTELCGQVVCHRVVCGNVVCERAAWDRVLCDNAVCDSVCVFFFHVHPWAWNPALTFSYRHAPIGQFGLGPLSLQRQSLCHALWLQLCIELFLQTGSGA